MFVPRLGLAARTNPLPGLTCCADIADPEPVPVTVPVDGLTLGGLVGFLIAACATLPLLLMLVPVFALAFARALVLELVLAFALVLVRFGSAASISRVRAVAAPPSPSRFFSSCRTI